ncbi:MAG TPA: dihydroorotate dehydrogenase [Fusobacterium sp.]|uniref:dihydroorotate dehydrogenase n=1 Tax=Fusobacterium sp. TaxID=68766 RepID=UPI002F407267
MSCLEIKFLGISMKNPLVTSSGCFGFGKEYRDYFDPNQLGGIVLKGITLEAREGNYGVRIAETPGGMLNCVGLENPGIDVFEQEIIPNLRKEGITTHLIANINGKTMEDYIEIAKRVDKIEDITMIELNISCPNVKDGGMAFGANPEVAGAVTREVRKVSKKPLIVKLSPNVTDIAMIAKIVEENGADAVSLINTVLGMAIDVKSKKPLLGNVFGGMSGGAIKPIALRMIYQVYEAVKIPIVGMGGILNGTDALEFLMAGASLLSIGTGFFIHPMVSIEVEKTLRDYCQQEGLKNIQEIVGIAHRR